MRARVQPILLLLGLALFNIGAYRLKVEAGLIASGLSLVVMSFPVVNPRR